MTAPSSGADRGSRRRYGWLHVLNAALFVGLWVFTVVMYDRLPERIPGHIGLSGVTRWEPREGGMWFLLPILATFHVFLFYALSSLASSSPSGFNVPGKKRLLMLPPEGQRYAMEPVRPFMYGMATWLLLLFGALQVHVYRLAVAAGAGEPSSAAAILVILVLALLPLAGVAWLSRAVRRRMDVWEAQPAGT